LIELSVWRDGLLIGSLREPGGRLTFFNPPAGAPRISVAMAPRTKAYRDSVARPFFQGLLPEGEARRIIAYDRGLGNFGGDDMALLAALGRDSAGALSLLPRDEHYVAEEPVVVGPPLTDGDVGALLRDLPHLPLGLDGAASLSLPGAQPKLLLTGQFGQWHRPTASSVSTHILKPPNGQLPTSSVQNEAYCMALAHHLGLAAAETTLIDFDGVTTAYDGSDGGLRVTTELALHIGDNTDVASVSIADVVTEASRWGMKQPQVEATIGAILDRLPAALIAARDDVPGVDPRIVGIIEQRARATRAWTPPGRAARP
jgi:HipA-like protein